MAGALWIAVLGLVIGYFIGYTIGFRNGQNKNFRE
jgi:membrane protein DedA with SNARE-associated domain